MVTCKSCGTRLPPGSFAVVDGGTYCTEQCQYEDEVVEQDHFDPEFWG